MDIKHEDFSEVQEYFKQKSVSNTRLAFRVHSKMVDEIPANFKNKFKSKGEDGLICSYCDKGEIMSQSHCLECSAWVKLREGLDLTNIMDMVAFFKRLVDERAAGGQHRMTPVQMTERVLVNVLTIFIDMMPVIDR